MASEIRVNKINSSSGVGTITLSPTGVDISGITTVSTLKVGTGLTASEDGDIFFTGVCTATTFAGSGANLTNLPAANLTGSLPAISGANLTGIAATDNVRTGILDVAGIATFRNDVNIGAAVTISESGIEASGIGITVANINGGQIGGRRNLVINGACMVAQRGTTYTGANAYTTVDRFAIKHSGLNEDCTTAQVDVSSGTTPYSLGFRKAYKLTNGNQSAGAGSSDQLFIRYRIEAQDMATSGWNYTSSSSFITLSCWVKASVAQTYKMRVEAYDGTMQHYPFPIALSANTWTKIIKTIPGNSNVQFDYNTSKGLSINWDLFYGTDLTDNSVTENAWQAYSSTARNKDMTSTFYTTDDATFEVTGVQLELGPQATPFEHRTFEDELIRCQRYFQVLGGSNGTYDTMSTGACASSTIAYVPHRLVTSMRSTPSFTLLGAASDFMYTRDGGDHNPSAIVYDQAGKNMMAVKMTGTSLNQDDATRLFNINTNGGYLMDAEI